MEYTTERGITIEVVPIPLLLDELQRSYPDVPQPTYTEHMAGGATQERAITDEDAIAWQVKDPASWEPHAEKWAAYVKARDERSIRVNDAIWRAVLMRAIRLEIPKDDGWIDDQRSLGIKVPDIPRERAIHYVKTEVIGGPRDMIRITAMASGANVDEEALKSVEAGFQGRVQGEFARQLEGA